MSDVSERPMVRVYFEMPDGSHLERSWTWADVEAGRAPTWQHDGPPDWLDHPLKSWEHPQDPITFTGHVKPGREAEARRLVGGDRG